MAGSLRQRGKTSWELVVYIGFDTEARKRRYARTTLRGPRRNGRAAVQPITPAREAAVYVTDLVGAAEALSDLRTRGRMSCWRSRSTRWSSSEPRGETASWWQQRRSWPSIC